MEALNKAMESAVSAMTTVHVGSQDAREAYEAFCKALGGTPERKAWEDMVPAERRAWRAASRVNGERADLAENMLDMVRHERDALAGQVEALRAQLRLVERARAEDLVTREKERRELEAAKGRLRTLLAEVDGPGGHREYQQLTATILEGALKGLPEVDANLPHPVWANRAAAALGRLRGEPGPGMRTVLRRVDLPDTAATHAPTTTNGPSTPELVS
jgi:hypothetical protein